jgi:hypothetical protein
MTTVKIPNTTLIIVDCVDAQRAHETIEKCLKVCSFSDVKLLTSKEIDSPYKIKIDPIRSQNEYSEFMLKHIHEYCDTLHMQIVQFDGWIINPGTWTDDWCKYDYMGALFDENPLTEYSVGNGGFSFRSRRLMKFVSEHLGPLTGNGYHYFHNEDGVISRGMRGMLKEAGFNFCSTIVARKFSLERCVKGLYTKSYGFHSFYALKVLSEL